MQIERKAAVGLFVALGLKNADKWNDARLASKLAKVGEMVDEDVQLEGEDQELLLAVMAANEAADEFEVVAPEGSESTKETEGEPKPKKAKRVKKEKEPKPARVKKQRFFFMGQAAKMFGLDKLTEEIEAHTNEHAGAPGSPVTTKCHWARVRPGLAGYLGQDCKEGQTNRAWLAGKIVKDTDVGEISEAMVAQLDEDSGKPNPKESATMLRAVREAVMGYQSVEAA